MDVSKKPGDGWSCWEGNPGPVSLMSTLEQTFVHLIYEHTVKESRIGRAYLIPNCFTSLILLPWACWLCVFMSHPMIGGKIRLKQLFLWWPSWVISSTEKRLVCFFFFVRAGGEGLSTSHGVILQNKFWGLRLIVIWAAYLPCGYASFPAHLLQHCVQESFAFATMNDRLEVVLIHLSLSIVLYNVYLLAGEPIKPDPSMKFISLLTLVEMYKVLEL